MYTSSIHLDKDIKYVICNMSYCMYQKDRCIHLFSHHVNVKPPIWKEPQDDHKWLLVPSKNARFMTGLPGYQLLMPTGLRRSSFGPNKKMTAPIQCALLRDFSQFWIHVTHPYAQLEVLYATVFETGSWIEIEPGLSAARCIYHHLPMNVPFPEQW